MRAHLILAAAAVAAIAPSTAHAAGEPTMPLADVHAGMHCTARSVIRGTDISTFDVEILDVVQGDSGAGQPMILFRASGPAIDATGIGPGFSGSPIACPDGNGVMRIAGAISEGIGEYGNKTALATPIESILGEPVDPPKETRSAPALLRAARPLATPLSIGGLSPAIASLVRRAAAKARRVVYATPARPRAATFPPQTLVPGSAMAVGLAGGAFTAGAIGTVAYVDGDTVWAFGHPFDAAGRRSLLLQDAYVYDVINNPLGSGDLETYKFATAGHDLGTITQDGVAAVVGRLGVLPTRIPLHIVATDLDHGTTRSADVSLADETALGQPTGVSALSQVGAVAIAQMAYLTLDGIPARQSGSMCVRFTVQESPKPLRFCNTYVGSTPGGDESGAAGALVTDFGEATTDLDGYAFGPLHITGAQIDIKLRRSLRLAYLVRVVKAPATVRRGHAFTATVAIQRDHGARETRTLRVRVPGNVPLGERALAITGTAPDGGVGASAVDALSAILDLSTSDTGSGGDQGIRTISGLRKRIGEIHRDDAVFAAFPALGASSDQSGDGPTDPAATPHKAYTDRDLRITGAVKRRVLVVP